MERPIMNKKIFAISIATAAVALPSQAASVYSDSGTELEIGGRLEGRFNISDANETATTNTFSDISRARMNIVGTQEISGGMTGFGKYEAEFTKVGGPIKNRFYYAGVKDDFGAISYGRNNTSAIMLTDYTDTLLTFGGGASEVVSAASEQQDGTFLYQGMFDAVEFQANLNPAMDNTGTTEELGWGAAAQYMLQSSVSFGLGIAGAGDDSQYTLAAKWANEQFKVAGLFAGGSTSADDFMAVEIVGAMMMDKFVGQLSYNMRDFDNADTDVDDIAIEGAYSFTPSLRGYVAYEIAAVDGDEDSIQGGFRYDF
jgi:predicted porin